MKGLDSDNFTGPKFAQFLKGRFEKDVDIVLSPSFGVSREFPPEERGFVGRIFYRHAAGRCAQVLPGTNRA